MPPFGNYGMDTFVSQHMSELRPVDLPELAHSPWLPQFILNRMFTNHIPERSVPPAFFFLRRAEAAFDEWNLAREPLATFMPENASGYFRALRHLENVVAAIYQAHVFTRKALGGGDTFQKNDAENVFYRMGLICGAGKHEIPTEPGDLHAVWISKVGLHTNEASVTFEELRELLDVTSEIANAIATGVRPETSSPAPT